MKSDIGSAPRERLLELQRRAQSLQADASRRRQDAASVTAHADAFLEGFATRRVYMEPGDREAAMHDLALDDAPTTLDDALGILETHVDGVGHNLGSERFFAYIPSGGLHISALGDYIASVTNRYSGVGQASPGAARMEETLLRWLAAQLGYPDTADGDLTSGGSIAALSAVITAREAHGIRGRDVERHVVYLTSHTHHTMQKALHIAGLGDCPLREVGVDANFRMDVDALAAEVAADKDAGRVPWLVAATAGTTNIGAVDPLHAIADLAAREGLWFHVDAAYGGAFAICDEGRRRLAGIERADSLIIDPHKGFFLPCGVGAVLVRDGRKLFDAYHSRGTYMQDVADDDERSACDRSPELTRPFRALRFWLPFKVLGVAPFAAALEEKLLLAAYAYEQLGRIAGIELGPVPDLSIVIFRYAPDGGDCDELNRRLLKAILDDGRIFLSSTTIDGRFTLRLAVLGYNTHLDAIDTALAAIRDGIAAVGRV